MITGNYEKEMITGLINNSKVHKVIITDRPEPRYYFISYLLLSNSTKNKLNWNLGGIPTGGVRFWTEDKPKPKPIMGFQLPDDIVLTSLKE